MYHACDHIVLEEGVDCSSLVGGISVLCRGLTELGAFKQTEFFYVFSVLRFTSGPRVKLVGRKSALTLTPTGCLFN